MQLATVFTAFLSVIALLVSGCDVTTRFRYPVGTRIYEHSTHHYYGQVVAYDPGHDFHNGLNAQPAVQIELDNQAEGGLPDRKERVWASCDVIGSAYETH